MPKVALRGVRRVHLREPRRRTRCRCATFLGDRILELEAYPFDKMTQRYGFSTRIHGQLEARGRLGVRVVPPAVRARPVHRPGRRRRPRRWCRRSTRTTTTSSRPTSSPRCRARRRCRRGSRARPARPDATSGGSTSCSGPACSVPTTSPTSAPLPGLPEQGRASSRGATTSSGCSRTSRSRSGPGTTTSPTRTGPKSVDSHIYEIDLYFVPPANAARAPGPGAGGRQHDRVRDAGREHDRGDALGAGDPARRRSSTSATRSCSSATSTRSSATPSPPTRPARRRGGVMTTTHDAARGLRRARAVGRGLGQAHPRGALRRCACRRPIDELGEFYDAIAAAGRGGHRLPRTGSTSTTLPEDAARLLQLLLLDDPRVVRGEHLPASRGSPTPGSAFFDMVAEPAI